jgi:hypothetical protein
MRHSSTQTNVIGEQFFQIVSLWLKIRATLTKDNKAESNEHLREFHRVRPVTIAAAHDKYKKNLSKPLIGVKFSICRTY